MGNTHSAIISGDTKCSNNNNGGQSTTGRSNKKKYFTKNVNETSSTSPWLSAASSSSASTERITSNTNNNNTSAENSRVLFLLYLIHRTWNVVIDTVDPKSKRSRSNSTATSQDSGAPQSYSFIDDGFGVDADFLDIDDKSLYDSEYSCCSCSQCNNDDEQQSINKNRNINNMKKNRRDSESEYSDSVDNQNQNSMNGKQNKLKIPPDKSSSSVIITPKNHNVKENQRPPVYNTEDYIVSLKKYCRKPPYNRIKSIYDDDNDDHSNNDEQSSKISNKTSNTLPRKFSDYISPITSLNRIDNEMSMKQFNSITDLLLKLKADLKVSFQSFVEEFVGSPFNGINLLLEILRTIQISQTITISNKNNGSPSSSSKSHSFINIKNFQYYQRRAFMDELNCLYCIHLCCSRVQYAINQLNALPIDLLSLAMSTIGHGLQSRLLALQMLTKICDTSYLEQQRQQQQQQQQESTQENEQQTSTNLINTINNSLTSQDDTTIIQLNNSLHNGHISVSEAFSMLRFHSGEPVRFRILIGILNSSGCTGTGELQTIGLRFFNAFLKSAENLQNRLYIQAELFQAGFDPYSMTKLVSSKSEWLEKLRIEIQNFENIRIDVEKLMVQVRAAEKVQSHIVILERRLQVLEDERNILSTMEHRLKEKCASLQSDIFKYNNNNNRNNTDKQSDNNNNTNNEHSNENCTNHKLNKTATATGTDHEDEGISSSETDRSSITPEPILSNTVQMKSSTNMNSDNNRKDSSSCSSSSIRNELTSIRIHEELEQLKKQSQKCFSLNNATDSTTMKEKSIIPVMVHPQPPAKSKKRSPTDGKKSKLSHGDDGSGYAQLLNKQKDKDNNSNNSSFFDDLDFESIKNDDNYNDNSDEILYSDDRLSDKNGENRDILNAIMDARDIQLGHHQHHHQNVDLIAGSNKNKQLLCNYHYHHHCKQLSNNNNNNTKMNSNGPEILQKINYGIPDSQKFNGLFFRNDMNIPQKLTKKSNQSNYSIDHNNQHSTTIIASSGGMEAKHISIDRLSDYGNNGQTMLDHVIMTLENTTERFPHHQQSICNQQMFLASKSSIIPFNNNNNNNKNNTNNDINNNNLNLIPYANPFQTTNCSNSNKNFIFERFTKSTTSGASHELTKYSHTNNNIAAGGSKVTDLLSGLY